MPNVMESVTAYVENGIVVIRAVINANLQPFAANVFKIPEKYAPRMPTYGNVSTPADAEDSGRIVYAGIDHEGNAGIWQITPLKYGEPFTIQYPLKRN